MLRRSPSRVLFAFDDRTRSVRSLQRAIALACALEAELHVLFVSPLDERSGAGRLESTRAAGHRERTAEGADFARAWLAEVLDDEEAGSVLCARSGGFTEQAAEHAHALDASLVVISAGSGDGQAVTALAHAAQLPVLVARDRAVGDAIVAATDLEDCTYPVLRAAAQLSHRLGAPLVALHNLSPVSVLNAMDLVLSAPRRPVRTLVELERYRLHGAVRNLPTAATPLLADEVDPVKAILREVHGGGVDLIAVGTRSRNWVGRLLRRSVPVQVVERASCSVLVIPIPEGRAPGHEALVWA